MGQDSAELIVLSRELLDQAPKAPRSLGMGKGPTQGRCRKHEFSS